MGRPKGFIVSEETKAKMKETKLLNKQVKQISTIPSKQLILMISGKEKNGFDYWEGLRSLLRPLGQSYLCQQIEREIVQKDIWQDIGAIQIILQKYFIVKENNLL